MIKQQITYIGQKVSQEFDVELMSEEVGFTLDILMELAGQAIATTVSRVDTNGTIKNILVLCGPGNNGGDGIVAARHLKMFGYQTEIALFKEVKQPFFNRLLNTCKYNNIPIHYNLDIPLNSVYDKYDLIVDALLGFSFKPPLRDPYSHAIEALNKTKTPILSVDIPSGWDVESGNTLNLFTPQYLISLTLPKIGVKLYDGRHFLGGRFIPIQLQKKYGFIVPPYQGADIIQELPKL